VQYNGGYRPSACPGCHRRCSDCKSGTAETGRECSRTRKEPAGWISYDNEGHLHKIVLQNKSVAAYGMQCRSLTSGSAKRRGPLSRRMPHLRPPVLSSASTMPSSAGPLGLISALDRAYLERHVHLLGFLLYTSTAESNFRQLRLPGRRRYLALRSPAPV